MTRILIADDSEFLRRQLRILLESHPGWTVCGEAANGEQAILMASDLNPDLAILDLTMPMVDGFGAAAEIVKILPALPMVIYTLHALPQMDLEAKKLGVRAVISKTADTKILIDTLEGLLVSDTAKPLLGHANSETDVCRHLLREQIFPATQENCRLRVLHSLQTDGQYCTRFQKIFGKSRYGGLTFAVSREIRGTCEPFNSERGLESVQS